MIQRKLLIHVIAASSYGMISCGPNQRQHNLIAVKANEKMEKPTGTEIAAKDAQDLELLRQRLLKLNSGIYEFWLNKGLDPVDGGVYGFHDQDGHPDTKADKGLIQQARSLWSVTAYYENRIPSLQAKATAYNIRDFILKNFRPGAHGLYPFKVSHDGAKTIDPAEQYYANSFVIYAFSEFGRVFKDEAAKKVALDVFHAIADKPYTESQGGFDQTYGGFDQSGDPWYFSSPKVKKAMSPHLHFVESFAALFRATQDPKVGVMLSHLIDVFLDKMIANRSFIHSEYLRDFAPFGTLTVKYGYQFIAIWVLYDASQLLGREHSIPLRSKLLKIGAFIAKSGFDDKLGGYFEEGTPEGFVTKQNKVWWVQAEALMGLWMLYEISNDPSYLEKMAKTIDWIENYQINPTTKEWWWEIIGITPSPSLLFTSNEWKDSYHHGRATMFLPLRINGQENP